MPDFDLKAQLTWNVQSARYLAYTRVTPRCTYFSTMMAFYPVQHHVCGPGSSVGIATGYGLDGPGIESR
jgi:hypothetical protein